MKLSKRQQGFTLIEVMFASFLGFLLIIPVFGLLFQSVDIAASLESKAKSNAQARETLDMLGDGGYFGPMIDDAKVPGLRGMNVGDNPDARITRTDYRIILNDGDGDTDSILESAKFTPFDITCKGPDDPLPDCEAAGEIIAVGGYVGEGPLLNPGRSISDGDLIDRTREIEIKIIDPVGIARENTLLGNNWETYRTIYTFNRD